MSQDVFKCVSVVMGCVVLNMIVFCCISMCQVVSGLYGKCLVLSSGSYVR